MFRRSVRVLAFLVPALFTSLSFAETWTGTDIGNTGAAGSQGTAPRHIPPEFTLVGAGADIQGTADSFRLLHTPVSGDVVAVTQVSYMSSTHPWAKAGVMVRASLDPNSANVAMVLSPGQACSFQVRSATGAATDVVLGPRLTLPYWVKLTRSGNTFTGYVSPDGVTWTLIASRAVVMPAQIFTGFAACSHVSGTTMSAYFQQADLNGSSVAPAAPTNVAAPNVTPHSADITWTDNSTTEDGFRVYVWREERHATYPELRGTVAANVTSFTVTGLGPDSYYWVSVRSFRNNTESSDYNTTISIATPQDPTVPPEGPEHSSAESAGPYGIRVAWDDLSDTETGFEVERATAGSPFARIGTTGPNVLRYQDGGLAVGVTYTYRVRAVNNAGVSAYSPVASAQAFANPPTPTNLVVDNPTATSLHLSWTDHSPDERGFVVVRAVRNYAYLEIARLAPNTTSFMDTGLEPNTPHSYYVRAEIDFTPNHTDVVTASTTTEGGPLPSGWSGVDIGSPALAGSDSAHPPTFTMQAAGTDIQGTADSFHYLAQTVNGDATVISRVASMTNTNSWAKAGVMIRDSLAAGAANAAMLLSPAQVCSFQTRVTPGAATDVTLGAWVTPPHWVKLTRVGNVFTGYVSPDGFTWTQVGSRTIVMPAQVYIGFAGCSHHAGARTTIAFDQAQATGTVQPPPSPNWTLQTWNGASGNYTEGSGNSITALTATSGDIYGATDSGVFVYRQWSGPATIVTRVNAVGNSNSWAKGGVMFRASLAPTAANAFVALTAGVGAVFQSRPALNGSQTTTVSHSWTPGPGSLLKLARGGGTISASFSTNNGTTWTPLGSVTDDYPETIYLGYAASSHNPSAATTATFAQP